MRVYEFTVIWWTGTNIHGCDIRGASVQGANVLHSAIRSSMLEWRPPSPHVTSDHPINTSISPSFRLVDAIFIARCSLKSSVGEIGPTCCTCVAIQTGNGCSRRRLIFRWQLSHIFEISRSQGVKLLIDGSHAITWRRISYIGNCNTSSSNSVLTANNKIRSDTRNYSRILSNRNRGHRLSGSLFNAIFSYSYAALLAMPLTHDQFAIDMFLL